EAGSLFCAVSWTAGGEAVGVTGVAPPKSALVGSGGGAGSARAIVAIAGDADCVAGASFVLAASSRRGGAVCGGPVSPAPAHPAATTSAAPVIRVDRFMERADWGCRSCTDHTRDRACPRRCCAMADDDQKCQQ